VKLAGILEMLSAWRRSQGADRHHGPATRSSTAMGWSATSADAQKAGAAGAIVPDLLVEESPELAEDLPQANFSLIQLVIPRTPRERALKIAESSTGFLYYVSVTGITGEADAAAAEPDGQRRLAARKRPAADLHRLRHQHARPNVRQLRARGRRPDRRLGHRPADAEATTKPSDAC